MTQYSASVYELRQRLRKLLDQQEVHGSTIHIYDRSPHTHANTRDFSNSVAGVDVARLAKWSEFAAKDISDAADFIDVIQADLERQTTEHKLMQLLREMTAESTVGVTNRLTYGTATLEGASSSGAHVYTARVPGANAVRIRHVVPAPGTVRSVTTSGRDITVTLATSAGVAATGHITAVATANLANGHSLVVNDGTVSFTIEADLDGTHNNHTKYVGVLSLSGKAKGYIRCLAKADFVDAETVTLNDGTNPATVFEFDVTGNGVVGGRTQVNISAATDAASVATILQTAINGVGAGLAITAVADGDLVWLHNDVVGVSGNQAIIDTVANGSFEVHGMEFGAAAASTTANQVATALRTMIGLTGLKLTAGGSDADVLLTNTAVGRTGNCTQSATGGGWSITNMTGGIDVGKVLATETLANIKTAIEGSTANALVHVAASGSSSILAKANDWTNLSGGSLYGGVLVNGADPNGVILYTAKAPGPGSSSIRVRHTLGGVGAPRQVTVSGTDITVQLANDGAGNVAGTETPASVAGSISGNADVARLVETTAYGTGAGVMAVVDYTALSAGLDQMGSKGPKVIRIFRDREHTTPRAVLVSAAYGNMINL